uniref:Zinc knuckle CX2CX4HX4C domain-containing protein n=1 Tax=Quercus lobata TaxID=97700 RepID=A0A7N2MBB4_QUELO
MEELTQRCENLKLSGKEGGEDADDNTALFVFMNEEDMNKVLWSSPWSYDKYLLVLHRLGVLESVSTLTLEQASFWVQIHGLPMRKQTRDKGERIGGTMGEVEKVDRVERSFSMGKCLRVRVRIDISEPICRGRMVRIGNTSSTWVDLQYERLPIFCYWCGKLNHDDRDCSLWIQSKESLGLEDRQFGLWLRANTDWLQRPLVAEVGRKETKKEKEAKANVVWSRNQPKPVHTKHPAEAKEVGCSGERPWETWATSDMVVNGLASPNRVAVDFEA